MTIARDRAPVRLLGIVVLLLLAAALVAALALSPALAPSEAAGGLPPRSEVAGIERVVDGDTLLVRLNGGIERVRLIGIDAPELARPADGIAAGCWAVEATEALAALVDGGEVRLERDVSERDRFGRLLRHAWVRAGGGWELASERLVAAGAAEARSYPPDTRHDERLDAAERRARDEGAGLWSGCDND